MTGKKKSPGKKLRRKVRNLEKQLLAKEIGPVKPVDTGQTSPRGAFIGLDEKKLLDLSIDVWKLEKNVSTVIDLDENRPVKSSLNKMREYIKSYNIETIDYDGKKYHEQLNVKILSTGESDSVEIPTIVETVKPSVLISGMLASHATVIVNIPKSASSEAAKSKAKETDK